MNMEMNPDTQPTQSPPEVMPPAPPSTDLPEHATEASGSENEGPVIPEAEDEPKREAPTTPTHNNSKHM